MGREETAREERRQQNEEIRKAFVEEALGRVTALEETLAAHRKTINQQGRALEALANVIGAMRGELAALEIAVQPFYRRWAIAAWRYWLELLAVGHKAIEAQQRKAGAVSIRKLTEREIVEEDATLEAAELEQNRSGVLPPQVEGSFGAEPTIGRPLPPRGPAFDHVHQYQRDGPFMYACAVDGCGRRATLGEITAEAEYIRTKAADADQSGSKLH